MSTRITYTLSTGARGPRGFPGEDGEDDSGASLTAYSQIEELTGYPTTFPPASHTHAWTAITDKPTTFAPIIGIGATDAAAGNHTHAQLHDAVTVTGDGIALTGQQVSLSIGTGSTQVAAGDHTHTSLSLTNLDVGNANYSASGILYDNDAGTVLEMLYPIVADAVASKTIALTSQADGSITPADITIADTETATEPLADTDLFFYRDVSGTPANKTGVFSRIWTYILSQFAATPLPVASGGTGATDASAARTNLGAGAAGAEIFQAATHTGTGSARKLMGLDVDDSVAHASITVANDGEVKSAGGTRISFGVGASLFASLKSNSSFAVRSTGQWGWSASADPGNDRDTALSRNAAGVVEINNGTAGAFRDIKLRNLISAPTTVAALTGAVEGARSFVTDSTVAASGNFGAIVAGGGTDNVPVFYDGTNWRIG